MKSEKIIKILFGAVAVLAVTLLAAARLPWTPGNHSGELAILALGAELGYLCVVSLRLQR